jgi:hypothetical protein
MTEAGPIWLSCGIAAAFGIAALIWHKPSPPAPAAPARPPGPITEWFFYRRLANACVPAERGYSPIEAAQTILWPGYPPGTVPLMATLNLTFDKSGMAFSHYYNTEFGEIRIGWDTVYNEIAPVELDFVDPRDAKGDYFDSNYYYRGKARCEAAPETLRERKDGWDPAFASSKRHKR